MYSRINGLTCVVVALLYFVTLCSGDEYQCQKYCHKDCSDYFPGNEFSSCVTANVHCSCGLHPTAQVVVGILGVFIFIVLLICCCKAAGRKNYQSARNYPAVVSQIGQPPSRSVPATIYAPSALTPTHSAPAPYNPDYPVQGYPGQSYQGPVVQPFVAPTAPPQNIVRTGGFIDPPPPYGQAIIGPSPEPEPPSYSYASKYNTYK